MSLLHLLRLLLGVRTHTCMPAAGAKREEETPTPTPKVDVRTLILSSSETVTAALSPYPGMSMMGTTSYGITCARRRHIAARRKGKERVRGAGWSVSERNRQSTAQHGTNHVSRRAHHLVGELELGAVVGLVPQLPQRHVVVRRVASGGGGGGGSLGLLVMIGGSGECECF